MLNRTVITAIGLFIFYLGLLAVDALFGVHVFSLGFLLSLVFFMPNYQTFIVFLLFGFFHDVHFQFPLGLTFLFITPYIFIFQTLLQIIHSRMLVLYSYLIVVASVFTYMHYRVSLQPIHILMTLVCGLVWIIGVYFYAIHRYQDFSFNTKKKSIQF